jgi:hypothetical protein
MSDIAFEAEARAWLREWIPRTVAADSLRLAALLRKLAEREGKNGYRRGVEAADAYLLRVGYPDAARAIRVAMLTGTIKPVNVIGSFCPFCGQKYNVAEGA